MKIFIHVPILTLYFLSVCMFAGCTSRPVKVEKNPEKVPQLPESLKSLIKIKETDNPVVIISKLKK